MKRAAPTPEGNPSETRSGDVLAQDPTLAELIGAGVLAGCNLGPFDSFDSRYREESSYAAASLIGPHGVFAN